MSFGSPQADPWTRKFVDYPKLNAKASDDVVALVDRVRRSDEPDSYAIALVGPAGAGKTHLFARLRHLLPGRAVLVLVRPPIHTDPSPRHVLGDIVMQLQKETDGVPQIDALVGSLFAPVAEGRSMQDLRALGTTEREELFEAALDHLLRRTAGLDHEYLRVLCTVPFVTSAPRRALVTWLSGAECDSERLGVPKSLDEAAVFSALVTLTATAATGTPLVLVFDQLENIALLGDDGARLNAYATLASELVDRVRGLVLVQMVINSEWERRIRPSLTNAQRDRLALRETAVALPTREQRRGLLRTWAEDVSSPRSGESPASRMKTVKFPEPFGKELVDRLVADDSITPRGMIHELQRELERREYFPGKEAPRGTTVEPLPPPPNRTIVEAEWEKRLVAARQAIDDAMAEGACVDEARVKDGLLSAFARLGGFELAAHKSHADVTIRKGALTRHVAILGSKGTKSIPAALKRLVDAAKKDSAAVSVAVREQTHPIPTRHLASHEQRKALLGHPNARWIDLTRDDLTILLALAEFERDLGSKEIMDGSGVPITEVAAFAELVQIVPLAKLPVIESIVAATQEQLPPEPPPPSVPSAAIDPPGEEESFAILSRLRVASLDRLLRELKRGREGLPRTLEGLTASLQALGKKIRWFGERIVGMRDEK